MRCTGQGFQSVDASLFKTTQITERVRAQFRFEVFNIFNLVNWANPVTNFSSGSFGLLTNTRNGGSAPGVGLGEPRNVQLALKILSEHSDSQSVRQNGCGLFDKVRSHFH